MGFKTDHKEVVKAIQKIKETKIVPIKGRGEVTEREWASIMKSIYNW